MTPWDYFVLGLFFLWGSGFIRSNEPDFFLGRQILLEKGFNGFTMPEKRVFFFFGDNTASVATADGLKLFDAAVDWLLGGQVVIPPKAAQFTKFTKNANGSLTLEWTGGGTLQAAPAVTGPWQDVTGATSPYTFTPTAAALFGRIKN